MKIIQWIVDVFVFTVYTVMFALGLFLLLGGTYYYVAEGQLMGLGILILCLIGLAADWNTKKKGETNGEIKKTNKSNHICEDYHSPKAPRSIRAPNEIDSRDSERFFWFNQRRF